MDKTIYQQDIFKDIGGLFLRHITYQDGELTCFFPKGADGRFTDYICSVPRAPKECWELYYKIPNSVSVARLGIYETKEEAEEGLDFFKMAIKH